MVLAVESYHDLVRKDVFPLIPKQAGRVLDLGGGIGATSAALKMEGRASYAVVADQVSDRLAVGVDAAMAGDLEDGAFIKRILEQEGPFDTILCLDILEHLRDPWQVVKLLREGLAPGGTIIASIPNVNYIQLVGPLFFKGQYELKDAGILDRTHIRWFVRKTAIEMMTPEGLVLEELSERPANRKLKLVDTLTFGLLRRFCVMQYQMRVRAVGPAG